MTNEKSEILWPALPYEGSKDTLDALHMKMQILGKVKLALNPFLNHWWNVALYVSASGINSGPIPYKDIIFETNPDFINHNLNILTSDNKQRTIPLFQCSVADFYKEFMDALNSIGITVKINKVPSEVPNPIPCDIDHRTAYDKDYVFNWWNVLVGSGKVFERFRSDFRGKASPIHFFWGSFDLCGTRFSGKFCAPPEHSGVIMRFAENEENFTFGFWAGNQNYPKPAFYSYIYPAPKGIESLSVGPKMASFDPKQGLFILDYDEVRKSESPEEEIMQFLQSTYNESAKLAGWDTKSLKAEIPS